MNPIRFIAIVLLLCGGLFAEETKNSLTLEQLEAIAIQPARRHAETNSLVVPEMLPLFKAEKIIYTGKERYKETELGFRLHVPENMEPDKKYPLILWLHGVGEAGDNNQDQLIHLHHIITYLTGPKKRDFFLLVPQTPQDHTCWDARPYYSSGATIAGFTLTQPKWTEAPFEDSPLGFSFAMLDQVVENYPVDTDRITVAGLSSGGDGTWRALERRPEQFAAAVPLVSWNALKNEAIEKNPILKRIPIWAIYSSDDSGIDFAREEFERIVAAGCNASKSEFGLCGHNAWTPAMLQADIFSWLLSRSKKEGEYIAVVDANVNPDDLQGVVEVAAHVPNSRTPTLAPALETVPLVVLEKAPLLSMPQEVEHELAKRQAETAQQEAEKLRADFEADLKRAQELRAKFEADRERAQERRVQIAPQIVAQISPHVPQPTLTVNPVVQEAQDHLYTMLAQRYLQAKDGESFKRVVAKLSPAKKQMVLQMALMSMDGEREPAISLQEIEALIDQIGASQQVPNIMPQLVAQPVTVEIREALEGSREGSVPGSRIIEECDREWAMTSDSLYGMFPADWGKEGQRIPDFIVKSTAMELVRILRDEPGKLQEACETILSLEHRPMSSPWFETSGGRLHSDIQYTLSGKGLVLVALLKMSDRAFAKKTLEKIETILGN